jgi:radical SAM protein with 4Fe4S-binding SPASM domain
MPSEFIYEQTIKTIPLWDKMAARRVPAYFDLEITARCNNDCRHCYINLPANDPQARSTELTLAEIDNLAEQAVALGTLGCLVTGGEPLLRQDFVEVYHLLKRKGLLVTVFTNACLVTEEHVRLFKRYPPRTIEVSVYGVTAETYERVTRKPGSYRLFRRGLDLLWQAGVPVRLKAMALRSNLAEMPQIAQFCREHTRDFFRFDPLLHLRYDRDPLRNLDIRAERLSAAEIARIEQEDPERSEGLTKKCDELILKDINPDGDNHIITCGAGLSSFAITFDGFFKLCSTLYHPDSLYDLRKGTLHDAWHEFVPRVRSLRSNNPAFLNGCRSCELVNLCIWCPATADLEFSRMDAGGEYFCQVARARAESIRKQTSA